VKKKGFVGEFREFLLRGNVIDLAVGIIVGGAFQAIVNTLVNGCVMPIISLITGHVNFGNMFVILAKVPDWADPNLRRNLDYVNNTLGLPTLNYGQLITAVINFVIIGFVVYLIVKGINRLRALAQHPQAPQEKPQARKCPYCRAEIDTEATRCPHCTSRLESEPVPAGEGM